MPTLSSMGANQGPALGSPTTTQGQLRRAMTRMTLRPLTWLVGDLSQLEALPALYDTELPPHSPRTVMTALVVSELRESTLRPFGVRTTTVAVELVRKQMGRGQVPSPGSRGQSKLWHKPVTLAPKVTKQHRGRLNIRLWSQSSGF